MAVNRNHTPNGGPTVDYGEAVLRQSKDVELSFSDVPFKSDLFTGTRKGILLLTPYRMIFVTKGKDPLMSFMMPFYLVKGASVEQPVFGANYIKGNIHAETGGGWEGQATFKLTFNSGGAIEFGQLMFKMASIAPSGQRVPANDFGYRPGPGTYAPGPYAPPPAYAPAPGGYAPYAGSYPSQPANGYAYAPPTVNGYGPQPQPQPMGYPYGPPAGMHPPPPAVNPVYMAPPPPYSGPAVAGPSAPPAPNTWVEPGMPGGSKATEAASSAYYNPANPHNVYLPMDQPPPYNPPEEKKKN